MASEIRVNQLTNRAGLGTITFANGGVQFSGITTFANGEFYVGTGATIINPSTNEFNFHTGGSNRFTINNSGVNIPTLTATTGTFSGNVSVGGVLTYEDVKNVDSVGIITARNGIKVTSGNVGMGVDAPTFSSINSISANAARGIEIHKDGTDTGSAIKLAGDNGSGTKAWSQLGYSGANATAHWANYNTSGTLQGQIVIGATGKVGIGTDNPVTKLEIAAVTTNTGGYTDGQVQIVGNNPIAFVSQSNLNPALNRWGFNVRAAGVDGNFSIYDYRMGAHRLLITSGGKVGIGSASPSGMLEVMKNGVPAIISNYNNQKHISMSVGGTGGGWAQTSGNHFAWTHQPYADRGTDNNLTERMRITSGGLSHIGLPDTTKAWDTHAISLTTNSATFACPATVAIFGGTGHGTANMAGGGIRFVGYYAAGNFTTFAHVAGVKENTTSGNYAGALTFHTRENGNLGAERLRITSIGKVGIGTDDPQQKLDVRGNVVIGIDQVSGNPGNTIGITTIRGHHVNSEGDFARLYFSNSLSASGAATRSSASIRGIRLGDNLGTGLGFWTNPTSGANPGVERLRIDQNGKFHTGDPAAFAIDDFNITATGTGATLSLNRAKTGNASDGDLLGALSFQSYPSGQGYASAEAGIRAYAASGQSGSAAPTELRFYTKPSTVGPGAGPNERFRILPDGRFSLGQSITSAPAAVFHLDWDSNNLLMLDNNSASTQKMFFASQGATHAQIYGTTSSGAFTIESDPSNNHSSSLINFKVDGSEKLRISSDGHSYLAGRQYLTRSGQDPVAGASNLRETFFQAIASGASHTFQISNTYGGGLVYVVGSRYANANIQTTKIIPIAIRTTANAHINSALASVNGQSGSFNFTVTGASKGITVTNNDGTYSCNCFVTFDITGFVA